MIDRLLDRIRTLTRLQVSPSWSTSELRTATFTSACAATTVMVLLGELAGAVSMGATGAMPVLALDALGLSCVLVLNSRGLRYWASVLLSAVGSVAPTIYALSVWPALDMTPIFGVLALLQFFLYTADEWRTMASWVSVYIALLVGVLLAREAGLPPPVALPDVFVARQALVFPVLLPGLLAVFGTYAWATLTAEERQLDRQRQRIETLLLNVLPEVVARRLEAGEEPIADDFPEVSVLFADIVGFTPMSAEMSAADSVRVLNELFSAFDRICERHGVEKIRTIGDGYMACAGAPVPRDDHADVIAQVALEMRDWLVDSSLPLRVRIGINSGAAVGGVIGRTKFHYDLWGDDVNVAARMESHGEPGRIHLGAGTVDRLSQRFRTTARGSIEVKGKGEMPTWWLEGRAD